MSEQSPAYCAKERNEARERLTPQSEKQAPEEIFTYLLHVVTQGQRSSRVHHHMDLSRLAEAVRAEHQATRPMPPHTQEDILRAAALVVADDLRRLRTLLHEVGPAILGQRRWMDAKADMNTGRFIGMAQATLDYAIATLTETPLAQVQAQRMPGSGCVRQGRDSGPTAPSNRG